MYKFTCSEEYGNNKSFVSVEDEVDTIFEIGSLFGQFLENTGFAEVTIQKIMPNYTDCKCWEETD